jgi:uncharacterized protein
VLIFIDARVFLGGFIVEIPLIVSLSVTLGLVAGGGSCRCGKRAARPPRWDSRDCLHHRSTTDRRPHTASRGQRPNRSAIRGSRIGHAWHAADLARGPVPATLTGCGHYARPWDCNSCQSDVRRHTKVHLPERVTALRLRKNAAHRVLGRLASFYGWASTHYDWPCIVEASYLLEIPQRFEMLKWIELGGAVVYPFELAHLGDIVRWMRRYNERGKREMDFADASLYWLAAETGLTEILTVNVSDFSRYRLPRGKPFTLL